MIVRKNKGKVFGAHLTADERRALNIETSKVLADYTRKHATEIDALFMWFLHEEFGFGHKRLRRVYDKFMVRLEEMCARYEMPAEEDILWLCTHKLRDYGIDLEQWGKERSGE